MWWDEERIEATVTRQFVLSHLRPDEQIRLDEPLGFGDGLTDDTYMEWIELKAKRIFLILVDIGVPDQIFGVIDDSWDDDDLPVPMDQVERLQLTYDKDEKLERRFFNRQFNYLLRTIQKGDALCYDDEEVVPLEFAERKVVGQVTGISQSNVDKVHLLGKPEETFIRRRIPLGSIPGRMPQEEFLSGVEAIRAVQHDHLISLWASYIHQDCGYLLLTPSHESTLKAFLNVTPPAIKILNKLDRRVLLLNWLHCLAGALSFLHGQGLSHKNIKPSTVLLDFDNHVLLSDSSAFSSTALAGEKRGFDKETYDYSAPEHAQRPPTTTPILVPMSSPVARPGSARRSTISNGSPQSPNSPTETSSIWAVLGSTGNLSAYTSTSPPRNSPPKRNSLSKHDPQKSDIFSLGTVFLEIMTFFMKRASRNFASHRSAKNKTPGRGGGLPDSSFHKNLGQVESWMASLAKEASKKEDQIFSGISPILCLIERMLSINPDERPTARHVEEQIRVIITEKCGLGAQSRRVCGDSTTSRGEIHCDTHESENTDFNFGFEDLRITSQRLAAEACAAVNTSETEVKTVGLNGGIVYGATSPVLVKSYSTESKVGGISLTLVNSQRSDRAASVTTRSSNGSDGLVRKQTTRDFTGGKAKTKVKAWQAPAYAEISFG